MRTTIAIPWTPGVKSVYFYPFVTDKPESFNIVKGTHEVCFISVSYQMLFQFFITEHSWQIYKMKCHLPLYLLLLNTANN